MNNSPGPVAAIFGIVFIAGMASCETKKSVTVDEQQLNTEISKINTLLRDTSFAAAMAGGQEATFYYSQGQAVPEFFAGPDSLIHKSQREEKIATNLAGFYALETGIGALMAEKRGSPVEWLHKIVDHTIDSSSMLLLNRFANATWKASQPFRSLERITKDNFTVARLLSKEEIKKDADQISSAASVLLDSLKPNAGSPSLVQMKKIASLLRNKEFAVTMAAEMDAAYYKGQGKTAQAFLT